MPTNRSRKNRRRIQAAEKALAKVVPEKSQASKKRSGGSRRSSPRPTGLHPWCSALLTQNFPTCTLPSFGSTVPYNTRSYFLRYTPTAGAAVESSFVMNPYLVFTDYLNWERYTAASPLWQYAPTAMTNSSTTPSGQLPSDGTYYTALTFNDQYVSTSAMGYSGYVRPRYVKYRIIYTGTEYYKGGQVYFLHNPESACYIIGNDATSATGPSFESAIKSNTQLANNTPNVSVHQIGDELELVWFPPNYEFQQVDSHLPVVTATATGLYMDNTKLDRYLPDDTATNTAMPSRQTGYCSGFKLIPANGTAATALTYTVEVEVVLDVAIHYSAASAAATPGAAAIRATQRAISHPLHEAQIKNTLSYVHAHRQKSVVSSRNTSNAVTKSLTSGLANVASGMASEAGEQIAARLGAML